MTANVIIVARLLLLDEGKMCDSELSLMQNGFVQRRFIVIIERVALNRRDVLLLLQSAEHAQQHGRCGRGDLALVASDLVRREVLPASMALQSRRCAPSRARFRALTSRIFSVLLLSITSLMLSQCSTCHMRMSQSYERRREMIVRTRPALHQSISYA